MDKYLFERGLLDRIDFQFARYSYAWEIDPETGERSKLIPINDEQLREQKRLFLRSCILAEGYGL
jgi:hypothetical protein